MVHGLLPESLILTMIVAIMSINGAITSKSPHCNSYSFVKILDMYSEQIGGLYMDD